MKPLPLALLALLPATAFAQPLDCPEPQVAVAVKISQPVMRFQATILNPAPEGVDTRDDYLVTKSWVWDTSAYDSLEDGKRYQTCSVIKGEYITIVKAVEIQKHKQQ